MKVLVTGGAGFIGSHIVDALIEHGHEVAVVDNLSTGHARNLNPKASFYRVDVTDPAALRDVFEREQPAAVIHQAAQVSVAQSVAHPAEDARTNILGTLHVLECSLACGAGKFVFASSAAVYGEPQHVPIDEAHPTEPISPYGIAKRTCERYIEVLCQGTALRPVILRYANVYGPRQDASGEGGVIAIFADRIARGEPLHIHGDGRQTRDFVHVADVARANLVAATIPVAGTFNIGTGTETTVLEIAQVMIREADAPERLTFGPERPGDIRRSCLDVAAARERLRWEATIPMDQGLRTLLSRARA
ncbi:NAD-dependent epimerase/dehydratase family protein [Alicyclobacillus macrosporangiidus]|uniref:UDP-glucose 4-epimerase n=1 Tax=Alicyclobacillus macrosporangiidus TaxID=392015 RepID=A0A1I7G636_9BACL|nr:NAD-dependent epimerase/dehydratase family protein [Alicyclobacillus macrosporangiidus]SFU43917.1 UDP-glucose 4-epimerase [Alicyclobacillus macrosporangiidus]